MCPAGNPPRSGTLPPGSGATCEAGGDQFIESFVFLLIGPHNVVDRTTVIWSTGENCATLDS